MDAKLIMKKIRCEKRCPYITTILDQSLCVLAKHFIWAKSWHELEIVVVFLLEVHVPCKLVLSRSQQL